MGGADLYGGKGLASKAIPLKLTEVGDRTYDVTTERALGQGEYAFLHQQTGRAFDFAVTTSP